MRILVNFVNTTIYSFTIMNDRIEQLLEEIEMSPSLFADAIGVQRATISHILSGRNNPSLDLVQKVLSRFPELNPDWILSGKGDMWRTQMVQKTEKPEIKEANQSPNIPRQPELFTVQKTKIQESDSDSLPASATREKKAGALSAKEVQAIDIEDKMAFSSTEGLKKRRVKKVILLYDNDTFEAYIP